MQPNDKFAADPLDFQRFILGLSHQYNEYLRFALDSQNFSYYHGQQSIPIKTLTPFGYSRAASSTASCCPRPAVSRVW